MSDEFTSQHGRRIAYDLSEGAGPGVVFLGGFKSDRHGTKALHLEAWGKAQGRAFLRFDYSGHGDSGGAFEDGCIGDWAADAQAAIETLTKGPQVLVGSSMGGWIALLIARARPDLVAGLVGIAAAPDFTEDSIWAGLDSDGRAALEQVGRIEEISEYGPDPYVYTRRLIMDGREQLVLRNPLPLPFPVRLLQGTADADVDQSVALRLLDHAIGDDIRLTLVKGADHRFSSPSELQMIEQAIGNILVG